MYNLKEFWLFIDELNKKCEDMMSFEENLSLYTKSEIEKVTIEYNAIISKMKIQFDQYIEKYYESIKTKVSSEISILINTFHSDYSKTLSTIGNDIKNEKDNNKIKEYLEKEIENLNSAIDKLNDDDINLKIPRQSLDFFDETFTATRGNEIMHYDCSSEIEIYDEKRTLTIVDKDIVNEIFTTSNNIFELVNLMIKNFKNDFDIDGFNNWCRNKEGNYEEIIKTNATSKFEKELYDKFQCPEVCKYYDDLLQKMEIVFKESLPNVNNGSNYFKETIAIGNIKYEAIKDERFMRYVNESTPLAKLFDKERNVRVPMIASLRDKGNIVISINQNRYSEILKSFINQLILDFLLSFPTKRIHLKLVDINDQMGFAPFSALKKIYNDILLDGIVRDERELEDAIACIKKIKFDAEDRLGSEGLFNIFDYNNKFKTTPMDIYVFVIIDFPAKINSTLASKIRDIMLKGKDDGVFTIIANNKSIGLDFSFENNNYDNIMSEIKNSSYQFEVNDGDRISYINEEGNIFDFELLDEINMSKLMQIVEMLKKQSELSTSIQNMYLDSILGVEYSKKPYYQQIKIPVGKDGGEPVFFELDVDGTGTSSALVAGGTGSGKSSFLHTIILSGAYNYSPNELEYYLIDFKDGVEFSPYSDDKNGIYIPHISFLSLKNKIEDAYDVLMKIYIEKNRRNEYFKKVNASDIKSYQNSEEVKSGKYPSFKKLIVIIDEYQNFLTSFDSNSFIICNKCSSLLLSLLKEIRSVGISLVLSSQSICIESEALDQINNRYVFSSSSAVLQKAFPEFSGEMMNNELNKEKGLVYMTKNGGINKKLFKAAFSGKTNEKEQKSFVKQINKKWGSYAKGELTISGNETGVSLYSSNAPFAQFKEIELTENNTIKTYFGKSAMSNELITIDFNNSDFCNYVILGEIKRTRSIEASIGLSFLYSLKKNKYTLDNKKLYYLDLNYSDYALKNISPFDLYKEQLKSVMTYSVKPEDIINSINELYNMYLDRKEDSKNRSREVKTPVMLIINSFSYLEELENDLSSKVTTKIDINAELASLSDNWSNTTFNSELNIVEKIKVIYENGHNYDMFVIIQERRASVFNKYNNFVDLSRTICCDKNEIENCKLSENGGSITISDLPTNYVVLFPNVSKIRPFEFDESDNEKNYIEKFVKVILDD